jgi:hypothetical protein
MNSVLSIKTILKLPISVSLDPTAINRTIADVKRPEREDDHLPPSSAEVKSESNFSFTFLYTFMAWCSDTGANFNFTD